MSNVAKGGFPGCPRRKVEKRRKKNFFHRLLGKRWRSSLTILEQLKKNLRRFYEYFGDSEEDDEFYGFSSEECGLRAYKRVSSGRGTSRQIPDILRSPMDLTKKKVTTRLAHARNSLDALPSSERTRRRKRTMIRRRYSRSEVPIIDGHNVPSEPLVMLKSIDSHTIFSEHQGFTKYKNSNLDFHRLSESQTFKQQSSSTLRNPTSRTNKSSPIKPATFIAPTMGHPVHHVTNVTPTCLKIKINPDDAGPGHPKVLAKALLARANKRAKRPKLPGLEEPVHTSTPISATGPKPKSKSFILPTKSSRSSRVIKANPKYLDSGGTDIAKDNEAPSDVQSPSRHCSSVQASQKLNSSTDSPSKGRPLLKEPTFRVAALANINNKPQPTRTIDKDKGMGTRLRARKLIKRARFKHPTSSSTLVVGNDFEEDSDKKRNLIREATFKMPNQSNHHSIVSNSRKGELSDLGISGEIWTKIMKNDVKYDTQTPQWTRQEIHNILHGANTFNNSWSTIARHYEFHPLHRDWNSVRTKSKFLQSMGLLSKNLKVKSSILLQLKHQYSSNPKVTVFTQRELRHKGMECNVECDIGEGGRMLMLKGQEDAMGKEDSLKKKSPTSRRQVHLKRLNKWRNSVQKNLSSDSMYLGLKKDAFQLMCTGRNGKPPWSIREIHNILHGVYIFGPGDWSIIYDKYCFQKGHNNLEIRMKFKSVRCRGLVVGSEVKKEIVSLLQPMLSSKGKKYFGIQDAATPTGVGKIVSAGDRHGRNTNKANKKEKDASSGSDLTSPSRKQAFHLFGTAPVWDDGSSTSGLQSLKSNSEVEEDPVCEQVLSTPDKSKDRGRKTSSESTGSKKGKKSDKTAEVKADENKPTGPRIKHVCRRASLVTGHKRALCDDGARLSALPREERERIAAEAEKLRGVGSESTMSSDTEEDMEVALKAGNKRRDKLKTTSIVKRRPDHGNGALSKDPAGKKSSDNPKRNALLLMTEPRTRSKSPSPSLPNHCASAGIILSPDSRRRLQQELHERDRHLPSIVKIDEWKERYELDDLWKMGGVAVITSTTPSTQFVCFLCGSVGRTRPMRRISVNSETSLDSNESYAHTPLFIFCCSCCEPFHPFCLDDHEQQPAIADAKKGIWICKQCRFCNVCGRPGDLLECRRCTKTYHSACLGPCYPTKPSKNRVWVCMRCVRCRSCGASRPGRRPGSKWTHDFQLCQRCGDLFDKGNFCPICRRCYRDEDYESRMVQCATCKRWVHSRCESLTIEMYTLLSHLPDDVQYICPDCDGRRAKVELELSHSDSTLTDESGNDSLEGDKMRGLLCKLPAPSWKKILENEIQTGIENVMMALFHNKEAACILKKSAVEEESGRPVDLFAIRFAVHNRRYTSVAEFSSDVCYILDTVEESEVPVEFSQVDGRKRKRANVGARGAFCEEMQKVFPWFDVYTGRVRDSSDVPEDLLPHATLPPYSDHNYAQWQDRDIDMPFGGPDTPLKNFLSGSLSGTDGVGTVIWTMSPKEFDDMRQCLFCGKYGDDQPTNAGRLVYCGQDEWVHVNCALWSAEVFERHDGSLQNVYSAVSRGRMMKCELCKLPGATVGCNTRDCPKNYHFVCAKLAQCSFQDDKKVFCARHVKHVHSELVPEEGFEIARRVVVDNDEMRPNKRWQRGMLSQNVTILLGSAIVHQLGQLSTSSDSKDYLIPVHFRMVRMFWSAVHAGRRVRYTITVTEQKSSPEDVQNLKDQTSSNGGKVDHHENHTISHADDDKPLNSKSFYPMADACRSNILERIDSNQPGPILQRKSHEESTVPDAPMPEKLPDTHYTVIGSCNRTLPQTITPLPSIKRSANTFERLLPSCTEATTSSLNAIAKTAGSQQNLGNPDAPDVSVGENRSADSPVLVSAQNPFLNIGIDSSVPSQKSSTATHPSVLNKDDLPSVPTCLLQADSMQNCVVTTGVSSNRVCEITAHVNAPSGVGISLGSSSSTKFLKETLELEEIVHDVPKQHSSILAEAAEMSATSIAKSSDELEQVVTESIERGKEEKSTSLLDSEHTESLETVLSADVLTMQDSCQDETHIKVAEGEEASQAGCLEDNKSSTQFSKLESRNKVQHSGASTEVKPSVKNKTSVESNPTSVSLLQHAKDALDKESVVELSEIRQSVESTSLWWKKFQKEKKRGRGRLKSRRKQARSDGEARPRKKSIDCFIVSGDETEEIPRAMQTRSRARSASLLVAATTSLSESEKSKDENQSSMEEMSMKRQEELDFNSFEPSSDDLTSSQEDSDKKQGEDRQNRKEDEVDYVGPESSESDSVLLNSPCNPSLEHQRDESSASCESSNSMLSRSPASPTMRNLRQFAKIKATEELTLNDSSAKNLQEEEASKILCPQSNARRFSHDPSMRNSESQISDVLCNGIHAADVSQAAPDPALQNQRARSKSADLSAKKKKSSEKLQNQHPDGDSSHRRYPRRNPFTCLRSFSGLSPNYAIQSYSFKTLSDRDERAASRLLNKGKGKKPSKRKNTSPTKSIRSCKRNSSEVSATSSDSSELKGMSDTSSSCHLAWEGSSNQFESTSVVLDSPKHDQKRKSSSNCVENEVHSQYEKENSSPDIRHGETNHLLREDFEALPHPDIAADLKLTEHPNLHGDPDDGFSFCAESDSVDHHHSVRQGLHSSPEPAESTKIDAPVPVVKTHTLLTDSERGESLDQDIGLKDPKQDGMKKSWNSVTDSATECSIEKVTGTSTQGDVTLSESPCCQALDSIDEQSSLGDKRETQTNHTNEFKDAVAEEDSETNQMIPNLLDESSPMSSLPPIEITRGIIEENQTAEPTPPQIEPDVMMTDCKSAQPQGLLSMPPPSPTSPLAVSSCLPAIQEAETAENSVTFNPPDDDMESPLSPRDEPILPLPMPTESFLVTSECPVLNADEVQSLLEMPPTTTTLSTPVFTQSTSTLAQYHYYPNQTPQQYSLVTIPQPGPVPYSAQQNVPFLPMNCGSSGAVVMYGQSPLVSRQQSDRLGVNTANTYTVRVDGKLPQPVLLSPQQKNAMVRYQYVQPQFSMFYQTPVMPILSPPQRYIASPAINTASSQLPRNQMTAQASIAVRTSTSVSPLSTTHASFRSAVPAPRLTAPKNRQTQKRKMESSPATPKQGDPVVSANPPTPGVGVPTSNEDDVRLTPDQAQALEKMIEFYSNKNKLSEEEKQIVRTIIAQQIKNKSLPLPPQESVQQTPCDVGDGENQSGTSPGQKRKWDSDNSAGPSLKRAKKNRSDGILDTIHQTTVSPGKTYHDEIGRSPLLDVYLNAARAESTTDDKLVKKWREVVRNLSRKNIYLDVPWRSRKGQRGKENRLPPPPQSAKRSYLMYEIKSDDGYYAKGPDLQELVANLLDAVQECRANACIPPTSLCLASILSPHAFLGVSHDAIRFFVEQLPGARHCLRYRAKYHKHRELPTEVVTHINPHGCARAEKYQGRSKPDMFSFLASKHRVPPSYNPSQTQNVDMQQNSTRRPTSMDLPMAMRFRHLKTFSREAVGVYRSAIHGRGLYCKRDIEAGEMVMEYTGEVIRCFLTDRRENMYEKKGIGCYMFRMDDMYVVDATMMGSGARFINHSCEPSCYSRIVTIDGKKHIIIFALRKILRGEELTYDYKFPIEDEDQKIMCNCGAKTCRKYMN